MTRSEALAAGQRRTEAIAAGHRTYIGAACPTCRSTTRRVANYVCVACSNSRPDRPSRAKVRFEAPKPGELWHLVVIPPDGPEELLISGATNKPLTIEFGREFAEQLAQENSARLAASGFRFEARVA